MMHNWTHWGSVIGPVGVPPLALAPIVILARHLAGPGELVVVDDVPTAGVLVVVGGTVTS